MRATATLTRQNGVSLVELMVGLVIGMLTVLVIMQVFSAFEGQKRTTTGTADAQTNGSIALYSISRDLQMAGYGLSPGTASPLECDPAPQTAANVEVPLTPVVITDGGNAAGANDEITVRYGTTTRGGIPSKIGAILGTTVTMDANLGCTAGEIALVVNGASCLVRTVTSLAADNKSVILNDATNVMIGAELSCLGNQWAQTTYRINNGNLEVNGTPRVSGIVNLQAQYGISDNANSNLITDWVDATAPTWAAPTVPNRNRIKALRIAVVARNGQFEREDISSACSSTTDANPTGVCAWAGSVDSPAPTVDLSNIADWQRYRYRVFETIIPLRNVIWSKNHLL